MRLGLSPNPREQETITAPARESITALRATFGVLSRLRRRHGHFRLRTPLIGRMDARASNHWLPLGRAIRLPGEYPIALAIQRRCYPFPRWLVSARRGSWHRPESAAQKGRLHTVVASCESRPSRGPRIPLGRRLFTEPDPSPRRRAL